VEDFYGKYQIITSQNILHRALVLRDVHPCKNKNKKIRRMLRNTTLHASFVGHYQSTLSHAFRNTDINELA
jgi:hypothetical protein